MKEIIKKAGPIFYWMWIIWFVTSTAWAMFRVLSGEAPFFTGVLYATLGGFFGGLLVSYIPLRIVHRHEIRKANKEMLGSLSRVRKRIDPLIKKSRKEMDNFVEKLTMGQFEEANVHKEQMERLQSYMDAIMEEEFDCGTMEGKKPEGEKEEETS